LRGGRRGEIPARQKDPPGEPLRPRAAPRHSDSSLARAAALERAAVFRQRGLAWKDRVPWIVEALRSLRVTSVTIDGEAVVCDERGITDFEAFRSALARRKALEGLPADAYWTRFQVTVAVPPAVAAATIYFSSSPLRVIFGIGPCPPAKPAMLPRRRPNFPCGRTNASTAPHIQYKPAGRPPPPIPSPVGKHP